MGFQEAVKSVYSNYAKFDGRATRSEYWYFGLFYFLVVFALSVCIGLFIGLRSSVFMYLFCLVLLSFVLGSIVPCYSVGARRLHDAGYSGWWLLLCFIPYLGGLILLVLTILPSKPANQYGPNPFEIDQEEVCKLEE